MLLSVECYSQLNVTISWMLLSAECYCQLNVTVSRNFQPNVTVSWMLLPVECYCQPNVAVSWMLLSAGQEWNAVAVVYFKPIIQSLLRMTEKNHTTSQSQQPNNKIDKFWDSPKYPLNSPPPFCFESKSQKMASACCCGFCRTVGANRWDSLCRQGWPSEWLSNVAGCTAVSSYQQLSVAISSCQ